MYDDGFARGHQWAIHADCDAELRRLQSLRDGKSEEAWRHWFIGHDAGHTAFRRIIPVLLPNMSGQQTEVAAFWRKAVTFDASLPQRVVQDGDFVHGFVDGALEVWKEAGGAGERGSEVPDEEWLDQANGPTTENDT
jgi:hypothetical protein